MKAAGRKRSTGLRDHSRGPAEDRVGAGGANPQPAYIDFQDSEPTHSWQGCSSAVARAGREEAGSGWAAFESRMGLIRTLMSETVIGVARRRSPSECRATKIADALVVVAGDRLPAEV